MAKIPSYVDDGLAREQDNVPLDVFLARRDRATITERGQPFFSGREREINEFRAMANGILLGESQNATLVFEGPPGAGKSALLAQFREETRTYPPVGPGGRRWLPVTIRGSRAESPRAIQQAVDEAIARRLANDLLIARGAEQRNAEGLLRAFIGKSALRKIGLDLREIAETGRERGFGAMGFRIGAAPSGAVEDIESVCARRAARWGDWQIVLLIDEAQGISLQGPSAIPGTLEAIHLGAAGLPIVFCAFGLHGTADALSKANVSRASGGRFRRLGGLETRESRMAIRRCIAQYGVTGGDAWERVIIERSANWPQHLAAYLFGALTVLKARALPDGTMGDARRSSLAEAMAIGDEWREDYYESRLRGMRAINQAYPRYARMLVAWLGEKAKDADGVPGHAIDEFLKAPPLALHGDDINRFLKASQHAGLLEALRGDRMRMPIPSFAAHLLEEPSPIPRRCG